MKELLRLNAVLREQKAAAKQDNISFVGKNISVSKIEFNEQSFDQSFLSQFK